ncbi:15146_t:CDS:2 [Cetraspora pellucida]|uniref:15146_t:CDS:1 n=1 Tax=Cetraspora pellucida TaxID=1433469 RepID=A0ACA9NDP9_9GLOM|nr:15146_t:CDS:2 [Cetraspora pellucida]
MPPVRNKGSRKSTKHASLDTMSISSLRKKIRDNERALRTKKVHSAKGQVGLERQLKALKLTLIERMVESKEKKMASKYRMVKHFDRKKVERAIKKAEKQVSEAQTPEEIESSRQKLSELQIDYNYIMGRKYMSLYPTTDADDPKMVSRRNEVREIIRKAMENNELDSLNKRFREEMKMKIIGKEENNQQRKKNQNEILDTNNIISDNFFGSDDDAE